MESNVAILGLTLRVGLLATLLCLPFAIGIGYGLARRALPFPSFLRAIVSLPMVMPPVAVGLALLWIFGATSPIAPLWRWLGIELAFTPGAAVVAAAVVRNRAGLHAGRRRRRGGRGRLPTACTKCGTEFFGDRLTL